MGLIQFTTYTTILINILMERLAKYIGKTIKVKLIVILKDILLAAD
jgi:hypothetical protein